MQCNMTCIRFPHSEIPGSILVLRSPRLIAESYVLHRYWLSRHPLSVPLCTFLCIDLTSNRRSINRYFRLTILISIRNLSSLSQIVNRNFDTSKSIQASFFEESTIEFTSHDFYLNTEVALRNLLNCYSVYRTSSTKSTPFLKIFGLFRVFGRLFARSRKLCGIFTIQRVKFCIFRPYNSILAQIA